MTEKSAFRPLSGSWLDFFHWQEEGKYFDSRLRAFTDSDWRGTVSGMADLGMKYIVLTSTAVVRPGRKEAYFRTDILPFPEDYVCRDPMSAVLSAADEKNMRVFVSCGWYGNMQKPWENMQSPDVRRKAFRAMEQLRAVYGGHPSFFGWYLPDETAVSGLFEPFFIDYVNAYAAFGRSVFPEGKLLIAPYGTKTIRKDDRFVGQLESLDCDYIAYQDEVGVRKAKPEDAGKVFADLRTMHDRAGRSALWADAELFDFEGDVYRSPLIPADAGRLAEQLKALSPYADEILGYEYVGIMADGRADTDSYRESYRKMIFTDVE